MLRKEQCIRALTEMSHKKTAWGLFAVVLLVVLSGCASSPDGHTQAVLAVSTPMPPSPGEILTQTKLQEQGCYANFGELMHANGPVYSPNSDGTNSEVRGLYTKIQKDDGEHEITMIVDHGLEVGYQNYVKERHSSLTLEEYKIIQHLITFLHETVHGCNSTPDVSPDTLFDYLDTDHTSSSISTKPSLTTNSVDLSLMEKDLVKDTMLYESIDWEEFLTYGLSYNLIDLSGLFDNPQQARDIYEYTMLYKKGVYLFTYLTTPDDMKTIIEMKSNHQTKELYEFFFQRFKTKMTEVLSTQGIDINTVDTPETPHRLSYYFAKLLILLSKEDSPSQELKIWSVISEMVYKKTTQKLTDEELNFVTEISKLFTRKHITS